MKQTVFPSLPGNSGSAGVFVHTKPVRVKRTFFSVFLHFLFTSVDKSDRWLLPLPLLLHDLSWEQTVCESFPLQIFMALLKILYAHT